MFAECCPNYVRAVFADSTGRLRVFHRNGGNIVKPEMWSFGEPFSDPVHPDGEATGPVGVIGRGSIGDLSSGIDKLVNRGGCGGGVKMDMSDTSAFVSSGQKHQPAMA